MDGAAAAESYYASKKQYPLLYDMTG